MESLFNKENQFSLKKICLDRLKSSIFSIRENFCQSKSVILILDSYTVRLLSAYVKMMELLECGVSNIEKLELTRKRFDKMHAIYLISPIEDSINRLISDFSNKKSPQYKRAHLLFCSSLSNQLMEKIGKNQELMSRIRSVYEFNQDFLCMESNVFSLNLSDALSVLYSKKSGAEKMIYDISTKLTTLVSNLQNFWSIDIIYQKPNNGNNFSEFSTNIANKLNEGINTLIKNLKKSSSSILNKEAGKITFVILERSLDPLTPLLHDFYYQPMLYDLLDINNNICEYELEEDLKTEPEEKEKLNKGQVIKKKLVMTKKAQLSEEDEVFVKYRYKHIAEVLDGIPGEFRKFVETNTNAQFHQGQLTNDMDVEKMSEIVRLMPQYQQALNKYILHMKLIERCFKIFESRDLKEVGELEQSFATGVDDEGHQTKSHKLLKHLAKKLDSFNVFEFDKIRLALIAVMCLDIVEKDKETMIQKFSFDLKKIFQKLIWLGIDVSKNNEAANKGRTTKKISENIRKIAKNKLSSATLDLCRYTGYLEMLIPNILNDIHKNNFENLLASNFEKLSINEQKSNKDTSFNNLTKSLKVATSEVILKDEDLDEKAKETDKVIIFMIGGMSYSEIRALKSIRNTHSLLILGSTHLMNARDYISGLVEMD